MTNVRGGTNHSLILGGTVLQPVLGGVAEWDESLDRAVLLAVLVDVTKYAN